MDTVRGSYFARDRLCAGLRDLALRGVAARAEAAFPALTGRAFTPRFEDG